MSLGLIFDIDGTLVTFRFDVRGTRRELIAELTKDGFDTSDLTLSSPTQRIMDAARGQVVAGKVRTDYPSLKQRLYSILDRFEMESSMNASLFPGTVETLRFLRSRSAKLGVLTNSGRKSAEEVLNRYSLAEFFDFVLTREDVDEMKPSPEGIHRAVSMFSLPKESLYYVGDSLYDIIAAKEAGLKVVSVATGNYTAQKLREEGADIVIDSLPSLPRVLRL
ncbi:MAG: HAD family hydrolase [Nitrososphaerales archaeon]|nr:HAD family hydrolase [Nitrososphaerales archaeon]